MTTPSPASPHEDRRAQRLKPPREEILAPPPRHAIVLFNAPSVPATTVPMTPPPPMEPALMETLGSYNIRYISPREIAELALDLYVAGFLTWDEYALLAFQAELQPAFDRTIGALTGQKAEPDRPRDYILTWERRLDFECKHNAHNAVILENTRRILEFLRGLERPLKLVS